MATSAPPQPEVGGLRYSAPHFYHLTMMPAGAIPLAVYGSFSAPRTHEVVVARGAKSLELLRVDDRGRIRSVARTEVFGVVRALLPFRLPGLLPLLSPLHFRVCLSPLHPLYPRSSSTCMMHLHGV